MFCRCQRGCNFTLSSAPDAAACPAFSCLFHHFMFFILAPSLNRQCRPPGLLPSKLNKTPLQSPDPKGLWTNTPGHLLQLLAIKDQLMYNHYQHRQVLYTSPPPKTIHPIQSTYSITVIYPSEMSFSPLPNYHQSRFSQIITTVLPLDQTIYIFFLLLSILRGGGTPHCLNREIPKFLLIFLSKLYLSPPKLLSAGVSPSLCCLESHVWRLNNLPTSTSELCLTLLFS